jgi:hypothetical protein
MADNKQYANINYDIFDIGYPYCPYLPFGAKPISKAVVSKTNIQPPPLALPGSDLPRALQYAADYSGCGFYRTGLPEFLLNYNQKMVISTLTAMVIDPRFYLAGYKSILLQRQATPVQKEFVKFLKVMGNALNSKIIYEVDDVVCFEDIPLYNRCRGAFTDPEIRKSIEEIVNLCGEMIVVSDYMKEYYKNKFNIKNVTTIPNYIPKFWFDRFYNEEKILKNYQDNKKRPKILVTASGTHLDVANATNQKDDYSVVLQNIIKTRKDFQWVFMGGFPLLLKPLIDCGDIKFLPWAQLLDFPSAINNVGAQVTMAALLDNHFNRSKSWIKLTESSHLGIPFVGQDLEPYKSAFHKFNTSDEMIDQIKSIVIDEDTYMKDVKRHRAFGDTLWLDDNLECHLEKLTLPFGDQKRISLLKLNPEQLIK